MEIIFGLTIGFAIGCFIMYCILTTKKEINLNPNDFSVPEILPMLDHVTIKRGFSVDGNKIIQYWNHEQANQTRIITVNSSSFAQEDFKKYWYENELNFYLKAKEVLNKPNQKGNEND